MPKNPLIFPNKFQLDGTLSDSGIAALEVAVNNLSIASKSGAMRQANAIRIGGLASIKNQNRGMPILNSLLPTKSVGKFTVPPSDPKGTVGYFIGGTGNGANGRDISQQQTRVDRFTFATNTIASLGSQININGFYTFANTQYGYYAYAPTFGKFFGRFTFQTETTSPIGSVLFPGRYLGASLSSQTRGYACAGVSAFNGINYANIDRFSFAGETCVAIGSVFQQPKNSCFGFGNKFNGYVAGGGPTTTNIANTIERLSYATEATAVISAVLSNGKSSLPSWNPGSASTAYLISGSSYGAYPNAGSTVRDYNANTIEKFIFAGETCSVLGTTLVKPVRGHAAIGTSTRCVIGGGLNYTDGAAQTIVNQEVNEISEIVYATEIFSVLSTTLSIGRRNLGALDNNGV